MVWIPGGAHTTGVGGRPHLFELFLSTTAFDGAFGACHSPYVPMAFGALDGRAARRHSARAYPITRDVSAQLGEAGIQFVTTGDPGWPGYPQTNA